MRKLRHHFPSLKHLWRSFRIRTREYLCENNLHGFAYFMNPRRPRWERICWFIVTFAAIGAAIGIIITIYQNFQAEPTLTGLDLDTDELVSQFPSVTLCNMNPTLNFSLQDADSTHYNMMYHWHWNSIKGMEPTTDLTDETYSQFFFRVSPECGDLYKNCTYGSRTLPCKYIFKRRIVSRGVCCYVTGSKLTKKSAEWKNIAFDSTVFPLSLDLLEGEELPPERYSPTSYVLKAGTKIKMGIEFTYSTSAVSLLLRSQRKCDYPSEEFSYSMCIYRCQKKNILERCGCLPWFMFIGDGTTECTRAEYNCLATNETFNMLTCKCYLPCNHTNFIMNSIQITGGNHVELAISNWPTNIYRQEIRFGWLDLLVSFGGIAGLFVGYSILTTVELVYYFTLRAYFGTVLAEPQEDAKIRVKKPKKGPRRRVIQVMDMKRNYYNYAE